MTATAVRIHPRIDTIESEVLSDNELVERYLAGEERHFREIVHRYEGRIVNFIQRSIGDRDRAQDLAQETFIRVYRHLKRFDTSKKFSTWIYTIASNLAKNELRNRSRSPLVLYQSLRPRGEDDQRPLQFEDSSSRPDDMFTNRHLRELVDATVATLAAHHREVFVMRELEGRSYEEIATLTRCNLGTVKSRLNRARHAFAERIAPYLD
ncbi:MAG: sigma-70 family RNA polymerase sigma factor [Gemmatimonadetes bacterium]|nr:sigma-70 family RNA polymerase sigma factor [Gemmatimonadota bacterium]